MNNPLLSVRELAEKDIESIADYWGNSDTSYLEGMGCDVCKMPGRDDFKQMLGEQLNSSIEEKKSYCIIWEINGEAVGHSNVNKIVFGEEAYMHLHLWKEGNRTKGFGAALVKMTLPYFFHNLKLKNLFCEPYALNPSPNKTLAKVGFEFVKNYVTVPGSLHFEQPVNRWMMSYDKFKSLE